MMITSMCCCSFLICCSLSFRLILLFLISVRASAISAYNINTVLLTVQVQNTTIAEFTNTVDPDETAPNEPLRQSVYTAKTHTHRATAH